MKSQQVDPSEQPHLPVIVAPPRYRFEHLPKMGDVHFGEMEWYDLKELTHACRVLYRLVGTPAPEAKRDPLPDYPSFAASQINGDPASLFFPEAPTAFPWIECNEANAPAVLCTSAVPEVECPFNKDIYRIYVPERWGNRVLKLAKQGIVKIEGDGRGTVFGLNWKGERIDFVTKFETMTIRLPAPLYDRFGIEIVKLKDRKISPELIALIPGELARKARVIPVGVVGDIVTVAIADSSNLDILEGVSHQISREIERVAASDEDIAWALAEYYPFSSDPQPAPA